MSYYEAWAEDILKVVEKWTLVVRYQEQSDRDKVLELIVKELKEGINENCDACRAEARDII